MSGTIPSPPQYAFVAWFSVLKKHMGNFTFTYLFNMIKGLGKVSSFY
jgi:hypothetical protein